MIKRIMSITALALILPALAACVGGASPSASTPPGSSGDGPESGRGSPEYSFTYATGSPDNSAVWQTVEKPFLDMIREKSGGRIDFIEYTDGSLLGVGEAFNGVVDGLADIAVDMPGSISGQFPITVLLEQGGAGARNAVVGSAVAHDFLRRYVPELAEFDGVVALWIADVGDATLTGPEAIRTIDDISGKRIRVSDVNAGAVRLLGGVPVIMDMSGAYEALNKGALDSSLSSAEAMLSYRLQEVAGYCTIWPFHRPVIVCVISEDLYNLLPADLRQAVDDACKELYENVLPTAARRGRDNLLQTARGSNPGLEIITFSDEDIEKISEKLKPIIAEYAKELDDQGYNCTEVTEWIQERAAHYNDIFASD